MSGTRPRIRKGPPLLRTVQIGNEVKNTKDLSLELSDYMNVLLGRERPPIDKGVMTLMEVASAYYARAKEVEAVILRSEREGAVLRGSPFYRFRTGELRSFIDLAKDAVELGSRRVTFEQMQISEGGG